MENGDVVGYQATCADPRHAGGPKKCSKEIAFSTVGGQPECKRLLKAWLLLSAGYPTRDEHVHGSVKAMLTERLKAGELLDETDLDAAVSCDAAAEVRVPWVEKATDSVSAAAEPRARKRRKQAESAQRSDLLGSPVVGVPKAVHDSMVSLASTGALPRSTTAQRERNKLSDGSKYAVPKELKTALRWGYIHPNVAPPLGMTWRCCAGNWRLVRQGG